MVERVAVGTDPALTVKVEESSDWKVVLGVTSTRVPSARTRYARRKTCCPDWVSTCRGVTDTAVGASGEKRPLGGPVARDAEV